MIKFNKVWEKYRIKFINEGKVSWEEFWALEDISFQVESGQVLGIIGQNGSGKSTILKLISGMLIPDKGEISLEGKVSTLMELGAGFNPELTGRENIIVNSKIYGLDKGLLKDRLPDIVDFAGLGRFIDAPIKYYSQGMYMRLAFALAIYVEPDILLIDDILAVGDEEARLKCIKKIFELKKQGRTIILVSHDMDMVRKLCDRVIFLKNGKIVHIDLAEKIIPRYLDSLGDSKGIAVLTKGYLRMAFNNGKVSFSYADTMLTKQTSAYVSVLTSDCDLWLPSFNLDWSIKNISPDAFIAEGLNKEVNLAQVWSFQISENKIRYKVETSGNIKSSRLDLFLIHDYSGWVGLYRQANFSNFNHESSWQEIYSNDSGSNFIGIEPALDKANLPFLFFEFENQDTCFKLFNTGYEQEARVMQVPLAENTSSVTVNFFPQKNAFSSVISQARDQMILKQQQEEEHNLVLQTVSLGALRIFADLKTKSLRLYFKDKEVTKNSALHCSFLFNGAWYDLTSCDWKIRKEKNVLFLKFNWQQPKLSQDWELAIVEDSILWKVVSEYADTGDFKIIKFGLAIVPEYQKFFCGYQEGHFSPEFKSWEDMALEDPKAELFGVNGVDDGLPAVMLENKQEFCCIIQNSDVESACRVLQLTYAGPDSHHQDKFSTKLIFSQDQSLIEKYVGVEKNKLIIRQEEERKLAWERQTISSDGLRLFADIQTKAIRIYSKDKEITAGEGLHAVFNISHGQFIFKNSQWQINKISENEMILTLDCQLLPLTQVWVLRCSEGNSLSIKVEIVSEKDFFLKEQFLKLQLKDEYANWCTSQEEGTFNIEKYIDAIAPIRLKDSRARQVILNPQDNSSLPKLFFRSTGSADETILSIYKVNSNFEVLPTLNFSKIIPKGQVSLRAGRYSYFEGQIVLNKDITNLERPVSSREIKIEGRDLRLVFDRGRGRVFWKQKELTVGLSLYTSIRHSGFWYDSYQALWTINKTKDKYIEVYGDWPYVPISQIWQIQLLKENLFHWKIEIDIHYPVNLEILQANLMLSPKYRNWILPGSNAQGIFPEEYTQDYDILPFRFWYGQPAEAGLTVIGDDLPQLRFLAQSQEDSVKGIIENTDCLYRARLLQYQKSVTNKLSAGRHPYFEGTIKIEDGK